MNKRKRAKLRARVRELEDWQRRALPLLEQQTRERGCTYEELKTLRKLISETEDVKE